jgi:hypothetical protein
VARPRERMIAPKSVNLLFAQKLDPRIRQQLTSAFVRNLLMYPEGTDSKGCAPKSMASITVLVLRMFSFQHRP